jgi:4-diphosphocytidyl-2-C-methyl-D-erythritol kinase
MAAEYDRVARQPGRARAKINLSLHVRGRRADGYHELESLVAFAGLSDALTVSPSHSSQWSLIVASDDELGPLDDNLVLRAARLYAPEHSGHFRLIKNLPVASGIGGGSADAAAALRLVMGEAALAVPAAALGADVPVCLASYARMMKGVGEALGPIIALPPLYAVLVNPRQAVSTADVFRALALKPGDRTDHQPHPKFQGDLVALLAQTRNDLEAPAIRVAPIIADVLASLRAQDELIMARMSGSGATCFGLFSNRRSAARAARRLAQSHPNWWVRSTLLR